MDRRINFIQLIQFQRNINISILFPCVGYCQLFVNSFNDCDINFLFRSNSAINVCWTACAGADDSTIYLISIIQKIPREKERKTGREKKREGDFDSAVYFGSSLFLFVAVAPGSQRRLAANASQSSGARRCVNLAVSFKCQLSIVSLKCHFLSNQSIVSISCWLFPVDGSDCNHLPIF